MKITRDQLKALLRELLIEILSEGLGNVLNAARPGQAGSVSSGKISGTATNISDKGRRKLEFDPRLDTPIGGGKSPSDALKAAVMESAGGNPVMAEILADTAMTTLPQQLHHGDSMIYRSTSDLIGDNSGHAQEQIYGEVADIFGKGAELRADGSSRWADLAFMPPKKSV